MSKQKIPRIETTRLILRAIKRKDAKNVFEYAQDKNLSKYLFWQPHQTIKDSKQFIKNTIKQYQEPNKFMWAIELKAEKKMIGTCGVMGFYSENKAIEIGYALNPKHWGQHYMKEALQAIIDYIFTNLDVIRIEGICVLENIASEKTMISCQMKFEGVLHDYFIKDNQILDCKMFGITRRNYLKNSNNKQKN
ncbi:MAG: GNAT family protein [Spiroplasma sp.]|nr:GNAT family protein [Spiroplasma sp.]